MQSPRVSAVVPLRPLTLGELLDAAVGLLRENALALLPVAFILAALEQGVLYPLRNLADVSAPMYLPPYSDHVAEYWVMIGTGYGTEAMIIVALGGLAAQAAAASLTGIRLPTRALFAIRGRALTVVSVCALALLIGLAAWGGALLCWVPWICVYGLLGLAVPSLVIDGKGLLGAIGRSIVLSVRHGLRAARIRLAGYVGWLAIRLGLGFGGLMALTWILPTTESWMTVISIAVWMCVNTIAYATLACLDAVLHLETRMRTEGLDIIAVRARGLGLPINLVVPR